MALLGRTREHLSRNRFTYLGLAIVGIAVVFMVLYTLTTGDADFAVETPRNRLLLIIPRLILYALVLAFLCQKAREKSPERPVGPILYRLMVYILIFEVVVVQDLLGLLVSGGRQ